MCAPSLGGGFDKWSRWLGCYCPGGSIVVNWCASRTVVAKVGPVGSGMRARAGVGGSVRFDFVCC